MSLALLFHYLMLNMFRILIHPSSGACLLSYFMGCIAVVRCVLVLRCGLAQRNTNTHRTTEIQPMK